MLSSSSTATPPPPSPQPPRSSSRLSFLWGGGGSSSRPATPTSRSAASPTAPPPSHSPNFTRLPEGFEAKDPLASLSESERSAVSAVHDAVHANIIPSLDGVPLPGEAEWADHACAARYLRATKWVPHDAVTRLRATLQWRRDYRPTDISAAEVEPESETGKEFFTGFDKAGRPILYLVPRRENTKTYDRQLRFVVFNLEKAVAMMPPGVESLAIVVDYAGISVLNSTPPSVSKNFLDIVSSHYPERLGKAFMVNPSWYLWIFFKLLGPFLDPLTKSKIHFVDLAKSKEVAKRDEQGEAGTGGWTNILQYIDADQLPTEYGGSFNFQYLHSEYWPKFSTVGQQPQRFD